MKIQNLALFFPRISNKKDLYDESSSRGKSNSVEKEEHKKEGMEIEENNPDEVEMGNNENELDNVIFNSEAVPNHIDIIDFNDGDEENMEPEIFMGNENVANNVILIRIFKGF